jgi:hypothetical protein
MPARFLGDAANVARGRRLHVILGTREVGHDCFVVSFVAALLFLC